MVVMSEMNISVERLRSVLVESSGQPETLYGGTLLPNLVTSQC